MSNKIATIPNEIQEAIKGSQIELTKAEKLAINYIPFINKVQEQMDILKTLEKGNINDLAKAKRVRIDLSSICSSVEKQKKIDKESLTLASKYIDSLYNVVENSARLTQAEASGIEKFYENQEKTRVNALQQQRIGALLEFDMLEENLESLRLGEMQDEVWNNFYSGTKGNFEIKKIAEQQAEVEKIRISKIQELQNKRKDLAIPFYQFWTESEKTLNFGEQSENDFNAFLKRCEISKKEYDKKQIELALVNEKLLKEIELTKAKVDEDLRKQVEILEKQKKEALIILNAEKAEKAKIELEFLNKTKNEELAKQKIKDEESRVKKETDKMAKEPLKIQLNAWVDTFNITPLGNITENEITKSITEKFNLFKIWAKKEISNS